MVKPRRLLVISHSGDATGAAIALLRIMRWAVARGAVEPIFVVRTAGGLLEEFRALGPTYLMSHRAERLAAEGGRALAGKRDAARAVRTGWSYWLRALCRARKVDAIYVNTATESRFVSSLASLRLPIFTHVHELEAQLVPGELEAVIAQSNRLLAVSDSVALMLRRHGARGECIIDVPEPTGDTPVLSPVERAALRRDVLMTPDDAAIIVGSCGEPSWRKGTDLFGRVAQHVLADEQSPGRVVFRWLGGSPSEPALRALANDAARLGLAERVSAVGHVPRAARVLGALDVFLSTSREDANPLVVLEAAAAGCPVVCFSESGGAADMAKAGGALAVPYLDVAAMATAVLDLAQASAARRRELGERGQALVGQRNTVDVVAGQVVDALTGVSTTAG